MVRAGRHGTWENLAFENGITFVGFSQVPDLSGTKGREDILQILKQNLPQDSEKRLINFAGQLNAFVHRIEVSDLIALPLKSRPHIAIAKVTGDYEYRNDISETVRHTRKAEWIKTDIPRTLFKQDLLYSFGAFMTVCQISRNNALARVQEVLKGNSDPGYGAQIKTKAPEQIEQGEEEEEETATADIEQIAKDQILAHMQSEFAGHDLARLIAAILEAEGYITDISPPGADGGVDILAGRGSLGFDSPRLCVQVKSGTTPSDVTVFRALQGTMQTFGAEQGLLVSWAGFKSSVEKEAKTSFFAVRLWDSSDVLDATIRNYEQLPEEVRKELPLKRNWALVLDE